MTPQMIECDELIVDAIKIVSEAQFLKRFQKTKAGDELTMDTANQLEDDAMPIKLSILGLFASIQRLRKELKTSK